MKEKKFLEQLNLYLDGVIDPAGAAELEQEILANPARRRIYNDYCRIHRATKLVYEHFRAAGAAHAAEPLPSTRSGSSAASATGTHALDGRTGGRAAFRPFRVAVFATGLAAACAVGVFVGTHSLAPRHAQKNVPAPASAVAADSQPAPAKAVATVTPVSSQGDATFKAPIAPEFRSDPYIQLSQTRSDPFALSTVNQSSDGDGLVRLAPVSVSGTTDLNVDHRFRPAAQGLESWPDPAREKDKNPFHLRLDGSSPPNTPAYEFSEQQ